MSATIDDKQLDEWLSICDRATKGPWNCLGQHLYQIKGNERPSLLWSEGSVPCAFDKWEDAIFTVESRTAMPALIKELKRLRKGMEYGSPN